MAPYASVRESSAGLGREAMKEPRKLPVDLLCGHPWTIVCRSERLEKSSKDSLFVDGPGLKAALHLAQDVLPVGVVDIDNSLQQLGVSESLNVSSIQCPFEPVQSPRLERCALEGV